MRCPFCGSEETQVKDSRPTEDNTAIRRRRVCQKCQERFTTFERVYLREIVVVKRSGDKSLFDHDKLARAITIACRKRPIHGEQVMQLVSKIQRRLESMNESEIPTRLIGEMAMEELATLDQVAYVRFASVYKDFSQVRDFQEFIGTLGQASDKTEEL